MKLKIICDHDTTFMRYDLPDMPAHVVLIVKDPAIVEMDDQQIFHQEDTVVSAILREKFVDDEGIVKARCVYEPTEPIGGSEELRSGGEEGSVKD